MLFNVCGMAKAFIEESMNAVVVLAVACKKLLLVTDILIKSLDASLYGSILLFPFTPTNKANNLFMAML
jgi:hypothetical protein